jgi:hypothetical protein
MQFQVTAPRRVADLIAELAVGGALRVSTCAVGEDAGHLAALTVIYLDGDVTTSIAPACLGHRDGDALLRRHAQEMHKLEALLQRGTAQSARMIRWMSGALVVAGAAIDAITGHSVLHALVTSCALGGTGAAATTLVRHIGVQLLARSARRAAAKHRQSGQGHARR